MRYRAHQKGTILMTATDQLASTFTRSGVNVATNRGSVSFHVRGLGRDAEPAAERNRISYRRGAVTEWYVNGPLGLEQGFTFTRAPDARRLVVTQTLGGELAPRQEGQTILFGSRSDVLRYSGLTAFDADGRSLPARLRLAGRTLKISVDAAHARFPVTIDPWIQQGKKLVPSDSSGNGEFGYSVAVSGDGNTALVGAHFETVSNVSGAGAAWIFTRSGGIWTQQAKLAPTTTPEVGGGEFGYSVALSNDQSGVLTAVVGAPFDSNGAGAAWVFTGSGSSWSERARLVPSTHPAVGSAEFGSSVAISDAGSTVMVGGPLDNGGVGAAWVFTGGGNDWSDHQKLTVAEAVEFGYSVALSGNGGTALFGSPYDRGDKGTVWASTQSSGVWPAPTQLANPDNQFPTQEVGLSVALSDDGKTALIGGPYGDVARAWVYTNSGSWTQSATLTPSDAESPFFGWSVAVAGDGNTALVGGPQDGAAWVFTRAGNSWTQDGVKRTPTDTSGFGADFGWSVALSTDGSTAMIGGPNDGASGDDGAAWPFVPLNGAEVNRFDDAAPSPTECAGVPGDCSLRQAIDHAQPGDTILVPQGTYTVSLGALDVAKSVTLKGEGVKSESVDIVPGGSLNDRLLRVHGAVTVELDVMSFSDSPAGAIENVDANLVLNGVTFRSNEAAKGPALLIGGGTVTASGLAVLENFTFGSGGVIQLTGGTLTLQNSTIVDNGAVGVYNAAATATLTNVTLDQNFPASLETEAGAGTTTIKNTVIGGTGCALKLPTSDGSNMDNDGSCGLGAGDYPSQPVQSYFAPLADNGGPNETEAFLWGPPGGPQNPGLDNGYPCPELDQRGFTRGTECDIGAVAAFPDELGKGFPTATTEVVQDYNGTFAFLPGTINLHGEAGAYYFEWGTTAENLINKTPIRAKGILGAETTVEEPITGLKPAHTYYFRVVAVNATSAQRGNVSSFLTPISDRYVNASWAGTAPGADPDDKGPATAFGTDAFATIHDAVTAANAGDQDTNIYVAPGTYNETTLDLTKQGLRLFGAGSDSTHINLTTLQVDADSVIVSGLDLVGPPLTSATLPVVDIRSGNDVVIHSNKISGGRVGVNFGSTSFSEALSNEISLNLRAVVLGSTATGGVVVENDIHDIGNSASKNSPQAAILVDDASNSWIYGNTITDSVNSGISVRGSGTTVEANTISGSGKAYPLFPEPAGIEISDNDGSNTVQGTQILRNTITGSKFAGIKLSSTSIQDISDTTIEGNTVSGTLNGGVDGGTGDPNSGGAAILITHYGVQDASITSNQLSGNSGWGILQLDTGNGDSAATDVHMNNITGNALGGIVNRDGASIDATNNWWGAADGPSGVGPGHGDAVSTNVVFDPWATSAFQLNQGGQTLTGQAGTPVSGTLAVGEGCATSATIFWGDGTPSADGVINCNGIVSFTVSGTHTYAATGTYPILVQTNNGNFTAQAVISAPPPANDDWGNAAALTSAGTGSGSGANDGATTQTGELLTLHGVQTGKTVWWKWTAPATGTVMFNTTGSSFDTVLGVFTGTSVSSLSLVASDDDGGGGVTSQVAFNAASGTTYYLQVGSFANGTSGSVSLAWGAPPAVPANDDWANAEALRATTSGSASGTNVGATTETGEPVTLNGVPTGKTVWWKWLAPVTGPIVFDTIGSSFDTVLGVFTGSSVSNLQLVAYDDNGGGGTTSKVGFFATSGTTYFLQVGGPSSGTVALEWAPAQVPANDNWAGASALQGNSGGPVSGNTAAATYETGEPNPFGVSTASYGTVWYAWTPSVSGPATFNAADPQGFAPSVALCAFTGDALSTLQVVGTCPSRQASRTFDVVAGTTYYVQAGDFFDDAGPFTLSWSLAGPPPANDNFANAQTLTLDSGDAQGSTANATTEANEPTSVPFPAGSRPGVNSVWYRWQAPRDGTLNTSLSVSGANSHGLVEAYRGPPSGATFADLSHVDGETHASTQVLSAPVTQGQTYYVQVMSDVIAEGNPNFNFTLSWSLAAAGGPKTYQVTTTTDGVDDTNCLVSSCTLRQAINAANAGTGTDTVNVPAGSYQLSSSFGALVVSKGMSIVGAGARSTTVLGPPSQRVFDVTSAANPVVIQGFTISGGTATASNGSFGGNVRSSGVLTLLEDTLTNGSAQSGGGVSNNAGTLLIDRSTISGNTALSGGGDSGGVQNFGTGTTHGVLTIRNSTITSNTARLGGAVLSWNDTANTTTVENSTIAFNSATDRGLGGIGGDGTFTFKNTIVSNNTFGGSSSNCSGTISSLGNNLEGGTDCGFTGAGDLQSTDPQLGELLNNGGPTDTRKPAGTSPALDHISSGCPPPATDQRGVSRPQGSACDIGAVEGAAGAAQAPSVSGQAAQSVTDTSATLLANINPNGSATTYVINFGTSANYGQQTSPTNVGSGSTAQLVSQAFGNLAPSTTYHFQFVATNAGGTTAGPDATFTTSAPPPPPTTPPSVAGGIAQNVTDTSATVQADIHPNGSATTYVVRYGTSTNYGQQTPQAALGSSTAEQVVSQALTGLAPTTTYHFQFVATNAGGTTAGPDATFTTGPQLTGTSGSQVSGTLASGTGCPASATIDWGDGSPNDTGTINCQGAAAPTFTVSGSHTYTAAGNFTILVSVAGGATYGAGAVIAAGPSTGTPPTIAGQAAQNLTDTGAAVVATINPNGSATTYVVRYGTTSSYGQQTAPVAIGSGSSLQAVSQALTGLAANTTYHFQFVATNANGTTSGPDSTFTTAATAPPQPAPAPGPQETTTQTTTTTPTPTPPPAAGPLPGVPPPVEDVAVDVAPLTGTVLVNGQPLLAGQQIPLGAIVDATKGTVVLISIVNGVIQRMEFAGAIFQIFQLPDGTTQLVLVGGDFSVCASFKPPTVKAKPSKKKSKAKTSKKGTRQLAAARQAATVRALWGNGQGSFQTKGRYAAATVRGTIYYVADRCDGTITRVERGVVSVHDDVLNKNVTVNAGESYLAKAK